MKGWLACLLCCCWLYSAVVGGVAAMGIAEYEAFQWNQCCWAGNLMLEPV
jgi:hypothetical protein